MYTLDAAVGTTISGSNNTNIVSTTINDAIITSTKSVTPVNALVGNTLFYTIVLTNSGNATANNVTFIDTIPNDTTFVANSFAVNGVTSGATSPTSIPLGTIAPGATTTVSFSVRVQC